MTPIAASTTHTTPAADAARIPRWSFPTFVASAAVRLEPRQVIVVVGVDLEHPVTSLDGLDLAGRLARYTLKCVREGRAILGRDLQAPPRVHGLRPDASADGEESTLHGCRVAVALGEWNGDRRRNEQPS